MSTSLLDIARGWINLAQSPDYLKPIVEIRLKICDTCPFKVQLNEVGQRVVTVFNMEGSLYKCGQCGCPLASKTASPKSSCPHDFWGELSTLEEKVLENSDPATIKAFAQEYETHKTKQPVDIARMGTYTAPD